MTSKIQYLGALRTENVHQLSGTKIHTDAPLDNQGRGESFSPTDLVATALGACIATIIGIQAQTNDWVVEPMLCEVEKIMASSPRRIAELKVNVVMPANLNADQRLRLERAARACPVAKSLSADLKQTIRFRYE